MDTFHSMAQASTDLEAEPACAVGLSDALIARMDQPGPRYTSYPTADRFVDAFTADDHAQALAQRGTNGVIGAGRPLSIYVHVPFCESVCYFCACNKVVTRDHAKSAPYLDALAQELAQVRAHLGGPSSAPKVSQLHLGGGTPTFFSDAELTRLMAIVRSQVQLDEDGEYSVEVDPRTVSRARLQHLRALGFNRLSFGVQDFDAQVQQAVHRIQPYEQVAALMTDAREVGFSSVNADLIYGLPRQSPLSFARTVTRVAGLRPDRIAMYGYAHLPDRFKPQRRIATADMPSPADRIAMLSQAIASFISHGYQYIGMDHFALPDDPLAVAKRQGLLHRNFQGYSTQADCDLIGLGVSAISRVGATYSQNAKTLEGYYDALSRGVLPTERGLALTRDDLLRRAVIMSIMCHGRLSYESVELAHLIDFKTTFASELLALQALSDDGLLELHGDGFEVTATGWYFVRSVAMVFDRHLQAQHARGRFSRVI